MGPELIIKYNILRMSFSYAALTTLQEAVDKKTIETFWYMPNIVYLNLKGFDITTLATEGKLREREFLFVFKGNRI